MAITLAFILVIMSAITLMLGINVFIYDDINQRHNQHYVILCGASSIWNFAHATLGMISDEKAAILFRNISYIGILVVVAKGILLASYWTETSKKFQIWLQRYVIIVSILIYPLIVEEGSVKFAENSYGYYCVFRQSLGQTAFLLYTMSIFLIGSVIVYHGFRYSKRKRQWNMAVSTTVCLCVFALGMICDYVFPIFGLDRFPASAFAQFFSVMLVYMVSLRYNVSRMTIGNISEYIYSYIKTPIIILDENSQIQLANSSASEFFHLPLDQVIGKAASEFFEIKKEALQDGGIKSLLGQCKLNGAKCDLSITEIRDRYAEPLGKLIVITDMTDKIDLIHKLDESRQEAIEANEAKSAFLANMSHEIRTPMNTIIGISELLLKRELEEDVKQDVRLLRNSGNDLLTIINDILDISKIESGKFQITNGKYMLASVLVDVVNSMSIRLLDKGIYFLVNVDSHLPASLIGDDLRIKQILINIIGNAIKFTKKGFIKVDVGGTYESDDTLNLIIRVQDSGIGIRKEDMGKLFGLFNQVDTRRNRNIKGTGLGLAICKSLCERMDGGIQVESDYGKGTTFTITIKQQVEEKTPIVTIPKKKELLIVVIERDPLMMTYFSKTFEEMGLPYAICSSPEAAARMEAATYYLIRRVVYKKMREELLGQISKEKIVLIVNSGQEMGKEGKELHQIQLPLFSFQLASILNCGEQYSCNKKQEYGTHKGKLLPFASVLIVDDNETNLYVAKGMMSRYKMQIDTASSGYDALVLVKRKKYDLIFMDHMMPGLDGIDTTHKIREMEGEYYHNVPIVALTANAMSGAKEEFIQAGFNDFLAKPIEYKELERVLREFILPHAPTGDKGQRCVMVTEQTMVPRIGDDTLNILAAHMEEINMQERVAVFGGDLQLYLNVLRMFYKDIYSRKEEVRSFLKKGEKEAFILCFHSLKSASYNVGAEKLGKMAELLEHAGKEDDVHWIEANIEEFIQEMEQIIEKVATFLTFVEKTEEKEIKNITQKKYLTREYLERLKGYCEEMDFTSLEKEVSDLKQASYEKEQEALVTDIISAYEEFEYETITELIDAYLK